MKSFVEIIDEFSKLNKEEIQYVIMIMLIDKKLKFEDISGGYVKFLEHQRQQQSSISSLTKSCLASYISGLATEPENESFFQSQAYVCINDSIPSEWIDEHLPKRTEKYIEKNKQLLEGR